MGWLDKLKDWAEDAVEEAVETVEETVDDAGSWVEEKFQDLAGDNNWMGIVDKAGDLLGERATAC